MHESRMIADVVPPGCCAIENVSGSRMATPLAPPRPGSTPMMMPRITPTNISIRLNGDKATPNPCISALISSTQPPFTGASTDELIRRHGAQLSPNAASSGPLGRGTENHISKIRKKATLTPTETGTVLIQEYLPSCHMKYAIYRVDAR